MSGTTQEADDIVCWRLAMLLLAGFPVQVAETIAESDVDLHEAIELVGAGCPPATAARILL